MTRERHTHSKREWTIYFCRNLTSTATWSLFALSASLFHCFFLSLFHFWTKYEEFTQLGERRECVCVCVSRRLLQFFSFPLLLLSSRSSSIICLCAIIGEYELNVWAYAPAHICVCALRSLRCAVKSLLILLLLLLFLFPFPFYLSAFFEVGARGKCVYIQSDPSATHSAARQAPASSLLVAQINSRTCYFLKRRPRTNTYFFTSSFRYFTFFFVSDSSYLRGVYRVPLKILSTFFSFRVAVQINRPANRSGYARSEVIKNRNFVFYLNQLSR